MNFLNWYGEHPWLGSLFLLVLHDAIIGVGKVSIGFVSAIRGDRKGEQ